MARLLSLLVLTLLLAGCETGTDNSRPTVVAATATAARAPTGTATFAVSAPTLTPAPEATPRVPTPAPLPTTVPPPGCSPAEVADHIARFFAAHSSGDLAAVRGFFPRQEPGAGGPDGVPTHFQRFGVGDVDSQGRVRRFSTSRLEEVWAYLTERHAQHERYLLMRLRINNITNGGANIAVTLTREADDLPPHAMSVQGAMNCHDQTIIVWLMGIAAEPPLVAPAGATPTGLPRSTEERP